MIELAPKTIAGAELMRIAERLSDDLASRAADHDRAAAFPHASVAALKRAGFFTAPIPVESGGLGVSSVHDVVVASSRLARADASVAIGVNMHLVLLLNIVRRWRAAAAAGDRRRATAFAASMNAVARDGVIMASAISEQGQDLTRPATTATRTPSGWRIDGHKAFCTMSPAATVLLTAVTFADQDGVERYGYAQVPADADGVQVHDDWDALGMRASGSHSVTFSDVAVAGSALRGGFLAGDADGYMERNLLAGLFHASASLGIAENAAAVATAGAARRAEPAGRTRMLIAANQIDLGAARATLSRAATLVDEPGPEVTALFSETQAAKTFVDEAATRIVDRALTISGGAGYLNGHPLARAYRDVRAGSFMQPLGSSRAYDLIGDVALGRPYTLH
jgi:alkylation response protein AidB-like acyl-CoA dehydrogenase